VTATWEYGLRPTMELDARMAGAYARSFFSSTDALSVGQVVR
jgi:hypothetical protein